MTREQAAASPALPLVSIGIPTFTRASSLRRAIESAQAQTYPNLEIVVSDNGSTDDTEQICRALCSNDVRIRYFRQDANMGPTDNFLFVLRQARGLFFMWLADDDWVDADYVAKCVAVHRADPGFAVVAGLAHGYLAGAPIGDGDFLNLHHPSAASRVLKYYSQVGENSIHYGVMRTAVLAKCEYPNTLGGDWILVAQMVFEGRVTTLSTTRLHRERQNSTAETIASIVHVLHLPRYQHALPAFSIARAAFLNIIRANEVFGSLGRVARYLLAVAAFVTILFHRGLVTSAKTLVIKIIGLDRARRFKALVCKASSPNPRP